jgi:hypothetical protein
VRFSGVLALNMAQALAALGLGAGLKNVVALLFCRSFCSSGLRESW